MEEEYFTKQILTYMGNKRTFLHQIDDIISFIKTTLGEKNIDIAEGFTGSGIVSRLFKNRIMSDESQEYKTLYVNDMSGYSETLSKCYLTSTKDLCWSDYETIGLHFKKLKKFLSTKQNPKPFISKHWAPKNDNNIKEGERAYYTHKNACNIDKIVPETSLAKSMYHLGSGTVSKIFITPISLSYTIDKEDCIPLNNKTIPNNPGVIYSK